MVTKKDFMLCHSTDEKESSTLDPEVWKANYKWDGERIIAIVDKGSILLLNRRGLFKNAQFREVIEELKTLPDCILDGEIISKDNNFNKLQSRAGTQDVNKLALLEKTIPVDYMVFDVLMAEGKLLTQEKLKDRIKHLNLIQNFEHLKPCVYGNIQIMLESAKQKSMEGIIIKNMNSPYLNKRSWDWLKLKLWKEAEININSYTINNAGIRTEDSLGNAVQISGSQSEGVKKILDTQGYATIYVQYLEKTVNGKMRFPSYRGLK